MYDSKVSVSEKLSKAREVFKSGRTRDIEWRREQLKNLKLFIDKNEEGIKNALKTDLNKSDYEIDCHELNFLRNEIYETGENLYEWTEPTRVRPSLLGSLSSVYTVAEPYGTAIIFGTWNYPVALVLHPLIGAIAGGNTCVLKPSELSEATAKLLKDVLPKYIDSEAFPVIVTDGPGSAELLKERYDLIFFTGGARIARFVMKAAAEHLTPVILELGGKNPVWVDPTADLARTARSMMWAKTTNTGQICICPDYVLTPADTKPKLIAEIRKALLEFHTNGPKESSDFNGKIINKLHTKRLIGMIKSTTGNVVIGGEYDEENCYVAPTIIDNVKPSDPIMQEEIFGPLLPILTCPSLDDAVEFINNREKPLAAYCFTKDNKVSKKFIAKTSSGGISVNDVMMHYTERNLPFGGVGESGMGVYHGKRTFDAFVHQKAVLEQKTPLCLISLREAPMTPFKGKMLRIAMSPIVESRLLLILKMTLMVGVSYSMHLVHVYLTNKGVLNLKKLFD